MANYISANTGAAIDAAIAATADIGDPTAITQDSTHRFVSDAQILGWNKAEESASYMGPNNIAPANLNGTVTFIFDDSLLAHYTKALPIFETYNAVATATAITDYIDTLGYLTSTQLLSLQNTYGWEIASHSKSHFDLTTATTQQLDDELRLSKEALEALGINVSSFIYPLNAQNTTVKEATAKYYKCARGNNGTYQINTTTPLDHYALDNILIDDHTAIATFKGYMDTAKADGKWLIMYMHDLDADDEIALAELLAYAGTIGLEILTLKDGLAKAGNRVQIGTKVYADNTTIYASKTKVVNLGVGGSGDPLYPIHIFGATSGAEVRFDSDTSVNKTRLLSNSDGKFYFQSGTAFIEGSTSDIVFSGIFGSPLKFVIYANGRICIGNVPEYADNTAAKGAGLVNGDVYRTGDALKVAHA